MIGVARTNTKNNAKWIPVSTARAGIRMRANMPPIALAALMTITLPEVSRSESPVAPTPAVVGKRSKQRERCRVIPKPDGGGGILKRAGHHRGSHKNAEDDDGKLCNRLSEHDEAVTSNGVILRSGMKRRTAGLLRS
jgi:hypothetical protein